MKGIKYVLGIISIALTISAYTQPSFQWGNSCGGSSTDMARSIVSDLNGNIFITGEYQGTADFNPGPGILNLTSNGSRDIFIQKLDKNGNLSWAVSIGGTTWDEANSVSVDGAGNIYICGFFEGTVDFDPGVGVNNLTSANFRSAFILKLDNAGNFLWVKATSGSNSEEANSLDVDLNGNILITGRFLGTVDFDPGAGVFNMTSTNAYEVFILKLDKNGNFVWAVRSNSPNGRAEGKEISVDNSGNIAVIGSMRDSVDFDPGIGVAKFTSVGSFTNDIFVMKLDSNANFGWAYVMGDIQNDYGMDVDFDGNGNLLVTGYFDGTIDVDPGPGVMNFTDLGNWDSFIQKIAPNGNLIWAKQIGGSPPVQGESITVDNNDDIYVAGVFNGTIDFDPGAGTKNLTTVGTDDAYILKLDSAGMFNWVVQMGGTNATWAAAIALGSNGNIYCTGRFYGTSDLDPGASTKNVTSNGSFYDIFTLKLSQCLISSSTFSASDCSSYTVPSGDETYTTIGTYQVTDTILNGCGKDSIMTINLTITGPSNGTDVITGCDSLQWIDGKTYYASNSTATHTLIGGAYNGCDSIVTLNLTIVNATTGTDKITACNSYKWIDGKTYTSSNNTATYTIAGGAANGCDSVVTLNLTINTVNATTTASNDTITANATGATYQWLDCDNNYAVISGATGQMFVASANGHYAVAVTQNGCTDTSACVTVTGVGIDEQSFDTDIKVYPNPSNGEFTATLIGQQFQQTELILFDITGKELQRWKVTSGKKLKIDLSDKAKGIYYIQGLINKVKTTKKILIQ